MTTPEYPELLSCAGKIPGEHASVILSLTTTGHSRCILASFLNTGRSPVLSKLPHHATD